jgi:hypothetical protein
MDKVQKPSNCVIQHRQYPTEIIQDHQYGFLHNKSAADQILHSSDIGGKKLEYNEKVHQLFVDFKIAYDSVRRGVL